MNTPAQILPLPPVAPVDAAISPAAVSTAISSAPPDSPCPPGPAPRRNGKIAHLSREHRDLIHRLFDDGATYERVSEKLAELGVSLNPLQEEQRIVAQSVLVLLRQHVLLRAEQWRQPRLGPPAYFALQ